jgi:lipopolysaccharide transport system permease protein
LWEYRDLLFCLIWRDIAIRYKQTVLGLGWAILQPLMAMVVFDIFLGRFGGMSQHVRVPYAIFIYAGLLPWNLFAGSVNQASVSLLLNLPLVSKVYCPRMLIPASAVGRGTVDMLFAMVVMVVLMAAYGIAPTPQLALVPFFVVGTIVAALAVGITVSALVVRYRDIQQVVPFLLQIGMFASPVAYSLNSVPEPWRFVYSLNPMVGMVHGFRAAMLGTPLHWESIGLAWLTSGVALIAALFYFRRSEQQFADVI